MTTANPYQTPGAQLEGSGGNGYINLSVFSPMGRLGRIRYLAYSFGVSLAFMAIIMLILVLTGGLAAFTGGESGASPFSALGLLLLVPAYIGMFVISIFILIKRSHDIGWSGWACLLAFVPLANLIFIFMPGTKGDNDYGAQTPPNGTGLVIVGVGLPILAFVGGIVAAISIPAYVAYQQKAAMAQYESAQPAEDAVAPTEMPADDASAEIPADTSAEPAAEDATDDGNANGDEQPTEDTQSDDESGENGENSDSEQQPQ